MGVEDLEGDDQLGGGEMGEESMGAKQERRRDGERKGDPLLPRTTLNLGRPLCPCAEAAGGSNRPQGTRKGGGESERWIQRWVARARGGYSDRDSGRRIE